MARSRPLLGVLLVLGGGLVLAHCGGSSSPTAPQQTTVDPVPVTTTSPTPTQTTTTTPVPDLELPTAPPVIPNPGNLSTSINVFGDTGWCGSPALAPLVTLFGRFDGDILLAGDLAYPNGSPEDFRNCFNPSFGQFKSRFRPSPGNHEYVASVSAQGYFDYFGERSGSTRLGYYSYKAAEWTVLMLNSNVPIGKTSAQYAFIRTTMQQTPTRCTMAVMHHPFDSSGPNGPTPALRDAFELMYNLGADVIIAGHDHLYERFSPVDPSQKRDEAKGIRQFTIGTGGASLYSRMRSSPNSEFLISTYGMMRLKLDPTRYDWTFMDMNGNPVDRGQASCH